MGTPLYIAPEQIRSDHGIDARADILFTRRNALSRPGGKPPFQGSAIKEVLRKHIKEAPVPLKELWLDIPDALSDIVSKAMEKKPEERFQSVEALTQELLNVCRDKAVEELRPLRGGKKKAKPGSNVEVG